MQDKHAVNETNYLKSALVLPKERAGQDSQAAPCSKGVCTSDSGLGPTTTFPIRVAFVISSLLVHRRARRLVFINTQSKLPRADAVMDRAHAFLQFSLTAPCCSNQCTLILVEGCCWMLKLKKRDAVFRSGSLRSIEFCLKHTNSPVGSGFGTKYVASTRRTTTNR